HKTISRGRLPSHAPVESSRSTAPRKGNQEGHASACPGRAAARPSAISVQHHVATTQPAGVGLGVALCDGEGDALAGLSNDCLKVFTSASLKTNVPSRPSTLANHIPSGV